MIPGFSLEYFEIVEENTLTPVRAVIEMFPDKKYYACIALRAGEIRLIDNIEVELR